jgi:hypothetical protein
MLVERLTMNYSMFFSSFFNPNAPLVFLLVQEVQFTILEQGEAHLF